MTTPDDAHKQEALHVTNFLSNVAGLPTRYSNHVSVNAARYPLAPAHSIWTATFRHTETGKLKNAIIEYKNGVVRVVDSDIVVANKNGQGS